MGSPKLLIALIWIFILTQLFCNWFEDDTMYTGTNISATDNTTQHYLTSSTDTTGTPASFVSVTSAIWTFCSKLFLFDYSIFYDYDPVTATKTANFLALLQYLLIAIGVVMWVDLAITTRRLILGG
jgi:hypothetical protein